MTRTPQEVFQHHAQALGAGDLDGIVEDYSDDAVFITPDGVKRGKAGVREGFVQLLSDALDVAVTAAAWPRLPPVTRWLIAAAAGGAAIAGAAGTLAAFRE